MEREKLSLWIIKPANCCPWHNRHTLLGDRIGDGIECLFITILLLCQNRVVNSIFLIFFKNQLMFHFPPEVLLVCLPWLIPVCSISGLRGVTLDSSNKTFDKGTSHHIQQRNTNFAGKHNEFRILAPSSEFISLHSSRNGSWHQLLRICPGPWSDSLH